MAGRTRYWILLSTENSLAVWIVPEGDHYTYEVAPNANVKRGDVVYLWSNPHGSFFGWGEVVETPRLINVERALPNNEIEKRRRLSILVNRKKEFHPPLTKRMMTVDSNLRKLIPTRYADLEAIPLRPGQAHYINDYVRGYGLEPPEGSTNVRVTLEEPETQFLIKTILKFGETTDEGIIVEAVTLPWIQVIERLLKDPKAALDYSPREWEQIIAGVYKASGFDVVTLTPPSGDYGRDIIATKKGVGEVRIIDQVKAYKPDHLVTANDVRALAGVLQKEPASKGFLTTTSDFAPMIRTDPFIAPLIPQRLQLINWEGLVKRLVELQNKLKGALP